MVRQFVSCFCCVIGVSARLVGQAARASEHDHLVAKHAAAHGVPEALVRRVIQIESRGNPRVVSSGNYGLMQIRLGTARAMGYSGDAGGLLDADTNMTYAVRYLAGAYRAAGGNHEQAIRNYQRGYYDEAKAQGFSPYAVASRAAAGRPLRIRPCCGSSTELERRNAGASSSGWSGSAMLDARISQQKAAEQTRIAEQQAMLQARAEQQKAAEQARAAQRRPWCRSAVDRQRALQQPIVEQRNAAEQEAGRAAPGGSATEDRPRAGATAAAHRTRAGKTEGSDRSRASSRGSRRRLSLQRSRSQPRRSARAAPGYAWYNPMRYFKHPSHQSHPLPRDR